MDNANKENIIPVSTGDLDLEAIIAEINNENFISEHEKETINNAGFPPEDNVDEEPKVKEEPKANKEQQVTPKKTKKQSKKSRFENDPDIPDTSTKEQKTKDNARLELHDWIQCLVGAVVIGIVVFVFIGRSIGVDGISMMNTFIHNDRVIMSNFFYTPKNGDIVVFQTNCENFGGNPLIKRVIAIENQVVDIDFENGLVYVDGVLLCEPYIAEPTFIQNQFEGPLTVSPGHVFVMGDNRNHSTDSRDSRIGEVDTRRILGKVLFIIIPGEENGQRNWNRFGIIRNPAVCAGGVNCICVTGCGCVS